MEEHAATPAAGDRSAERRRNIVFGLMLVAGGILLFLNDASIFEIMRLWPLVIVALGAGKVAGACCRHRVHEGFWLLAIGGWLSLNQFTSLGYRDTWPLLVVLVGILMVWDAFSPAARCDNCAEGRHGH